MEFYINIVPGIICFIIATIASIWAIKSKSSETLITIYIILALTGIGSVVWRQIMILDKENETKLKMSTMQDNIDQVLEITKASEISKETLKKAKGILRNPARHDLKSLTSQLSAEIFIFIVNRNLTEPQNFETRQEAIDGRVMYFFETTSLCNQLFGSKLVDISDKLLKNGYQDSELDKINRLPLTPLSTQTAAERLEILSKSMP